MCHTRTVIYQGSVNPDLSHTFEVYSDVRSEVLDCGLDLHVNDMDSIWPMHEDIWENRGGPNGRCLFRVVVVPDDWTNEDIRESICWWGELPEGQLAP